MAKSTSRSSGGNRGNRGGGGNAGSQTTTDHEQIRQWAESRGARPACVRGTGGGGDTGMIRLDFPGFSGEDSLQEISWDEWFQQFDENNLALLCQETTKDGQPSNFNKLVSRDTAGGKSAKPRGGGGSGRSGSRGSSGAAKSGGARKSASSLRSAGGGSGKTAAPKRAGSSTRSSGGVGRETQSAKSARSGKSAKSAMSTKSGATGGGSRAGGSAKPKAASRRAK